MKQSKNKTLDRLQFADTCQQNHCQVTFGLKSFDLHGYKKTTTVVRSSLIFSAKIPSVTAAGPTRRSAHEPRRGGSFHTLRRPGSPWQKSRERRDRRGFGPVAEREAEHRSVRRERPTGGKPATVHGGGKVGGREAGRSAAARRGGRRPRGGEVDGREAGRSTVARREGRRSRGGNQPARLSAARRA